MARTADTTAVYTKQLRPVHPALADRRMLPEMGLAEANTYRSVAGPELIVVLLLVIGLVGAVLATIYLLRRR